eukprot:1728569-Pleurochrysis_carterae.AAC.4
MALVQITVKADWSPAGAWVALEAETAGDTLFAADDDMESRPEPKCIPESAILSHLNKQPLFCLGGAQTCWIVVHPKLIDQASELHDQPTSPCTRSSLFPSFQSRKGAQTLHSSVRGDSLRLVRIDASTMYTAANPVSEISSDASACASHNKLCICTATARLTATMCMMQVPTALSRTALTNSTAEMTSMRKREDSWPVFRITPGLIAVPLETVPSSRACSLESGL